jgi:hypothetical protein
MRQGLGALSLKIAQRFNAGFSSTTESQVPLGTEEWFNHAFVRRNSDDSCAASYRPFLSSLKGLEHSCNRVYPALKRWAIVRVEEALKPGLAAAGLSEPVT